MGETVQEPAAYQRAGFLPRVGVDLGEVIRADRPQRRASSKLRDIEFLVHYVDSRRYDYFLHSHATDARKRHPGMACGCGLVTCRSPEQRGCSDKSQVLGERAPTMRDQRLVLGGSISDS